MHSHIIRIYTIGSDKRKKKWISLSGRQLVVFVSSYNASEVVATQHEMIKDLKDPHVARNRQAHIISQRVWIVLTTHVFVRTRLKWKIRIHYYISSYIFLFFNKPNLKGGSIIYIPSKENNTYQIYLFDIDIVSSLQVHWIFYIECPFGKINK